MKEILFRAKRIDNNEWVEGNVLQANDGSCYIATSFLVGKSDEPLMVAAHEVKPETLCQITGIVDEDENNWIPVERRLPDNLVNPITRDAYVYPVTVDLGGVTDVRYYSFWKGHWYNQSPHTMDHLVIAWMPRPEPYRPDNSGSDRFTQQNMSLQEAIVQLEFDRDMILFDPSTGKELTLEMVKLLNKDNYMAYVAYGMAIQALKKQVSRAPVKVSDSGVRYTDDYICPDCGKHFTGTGIAHFCYHCGQRLKWEGIWES